MSGSIVFLNVFYETNTICPSAMTSLCQQRHDRNAFRTDIIVSLLRHPVTNLTPESSELFRFGVVLWLLLVHVSISVRFYLHRHGSLLAIHSLSSARQSWSGTITALQSRFLLIIMPRDQDQTLDSKGTRRNKRKVTDVEKPSPHSGRKRQVARQVQ